MDLLQLTDKSDCPCGKSHSVSTQKICFTYHIENDLPPLLSTLIESNMAGLMVCDLNTYNALGKKIEEICVNHNISLKTCLYLTKEILIPDEHALGTLLIKIEPNINYIVGVGAGTINDLARIIAYKFKIPFISVPTAPSVDGFASSVAPLIIEGQKITYPAVAPYAIIADIPTLVNSPLRMKAAGLGDLLGKYSCQLDWMLSYKIHQDSYCEYIANLVQQAVQQTVQAFDDHHPYNDQMVESLIRGLTLSGLAISMEGTSRPASNSEHHLSHFFELAALNGKVAHFMHGETVALGLCLILKLYQTVFHHSYQEFLEIYLTHRQDETETQRIETLTRAFSPNPKRYIENWRKSQINETQIKHRLYQLETEWEYFQKLIGHTIGSVSSLEQLMHNAQIPIDYNHFGYSKTLISDALLSAKEIRERYTILTCLDELHLLSYFVNEIVAQI